MVIDNEFLHDPRPMNEAKCLISQGHDVHVLCYNHGTYSKEETVDQINIKRVPITSKQANIYFAFNNIFPKFRSLWEHEISLFIKERGIECLHAHDLYMAEPALKVKRKTGIPVVLDLHENYPAAIKAYHWANKFPNLLIVRPAQYKKKERALLGGVDRLVVLSGAFREKLIAEYSELSREKFVEYPNVPDIETFRDYKINPEITEIKGNNFILFYFGAIAERRGIFTCFEAVELLAKSIKNLKMLLIGPIDRRERERFYRYMNRPVLKKRIIYHEWKDISEFPSFVNISDICLSPIVKNDQHESGVANKVFQYMLFKKPLVVSNCAPQMELVEQNKCGLSFISDSSRDLAEKIHRLYLDKGLRDEMGASGHRAIISKYNLKNYGRKLSRLYGELEAQTVSLVKKKPGSLSDLSDHYEGKRLKSECFYRFWLIVVSI